MSISRSSPKGMKRSTQVGNCSPQAVCAPRTGSVGVPSPSVPATRPPATIVARIRAAATTVSARRPRLPDGSAGCGSEPSRRSARSTPRNSIARPRWAATRYSWRPSSTVRPPSPAWARTRTPAAAEPPTTQRCSRRWRHACHAVISIRTETIPAVIRWLYSITDSAEAAGRTPPSQSGQPCVPEPSGPQPRPESLTRTIPPIRISTNVATIVAVTRRRNRRKIGGSVAARRDFHRAQDTGGSPLSPSAAPALRAGLRPRARWRQRRGRLRLRRGARPARAAPAARRRPRARGSPRGCRASAPGCGRRGRRRSCAAAAARARTTRASSRATDRVPPAAAAVRGRQVPELDQHPDRQEERAERADQVERRDAGVLVVPEDVHRLALEPGEEHREGEDDRAAEDQRRRRLGRTLRHRPAGDLRQPVVERGERREGEADDHHDRVLLGGRRVLELEADRDHRRARAARRGRRRGGPRIPAPAPAAPAARSRPTTSSRSS